MGTPKLLDPVPPLIADAEPNGFGVPNPVPPSLDVPNTLLLLAPLPKPVVLVVENAEVLPNPPLEDPNPPLVCVPPNPDVGLELADPNGDFSEEANADNPEEANAEVEVVSVKLEVGFSAVGDFARPNGDADEVFAKPDVVVDVDCGCRLVEDGVSSVFELVVALCCILVESFSISSCDGTSTSTPGPPGDFCASASVSSCNVSFRSPSILLYAFEWSPLAISLDLMRL